MNHCKECGIEYEVGEKDFCSKSCLRKNFQRRIEDATYKDSSHTKEFSSSNDD
ncbi:MAG: hypothetical protein HKO48_03590 [Nitrosopumilus sp.]|nr:hypothetical protein [Nitrosopumilus sp.]